MKIAIGCDHAGYPLKEKIHEYLLGKGYEVLDFGTNGLDSVDYPVFGAAVGHAVAEKKAVFGIICCGSGEGIMIACNKIPGVRAGIGYNDEVSKLLREHNDANVIAFGARYMSVEEVLPRVDLFLSTPFAGGRHQKRVELISELESK